MDDRQHRVCFDDCEGPLDGASTGRDHDQSDASMRTATAGFDERADADGIDERCL
jgi:hypothetical protein